ncbi:MAG: hypothetical protein Q7S04_01445 [Candidatus Moranbacteria bacterium]|nr:hypothetical protein [Candidatus Moranbacteria bacterium]
MLKAQKKKKSEVVLGWHFPALDHADTEGLNDPLLGYFGGDYNQCVAREVIQNSIDARDDTECPVFVKFEKLKLPIADVPGIAELKEHIKICLAQAKSEHNDKAEKHYRDALKIATATSIDVLRASDYNTSGLDGVDDDKKGKWHRLVKAVGENQLTGAGGGSYGIGKGAPFVASMMRAVYYSTKNSSGEVIFQGKARLLSHQWKGSDYRGVGSFGIEGYKSVREEGKIPEIFIRDKQGTDINIIGYNVTPSWKDELAKSVLDNFWMAIHSNDLEVIISDGADEISINRATLPELLEKHSRDEGLIYYRTVINPTRTFKKQLPLLGACTFYVRIEERFPRETIYMRRPKMRVSKWRFPKTLHEPHAGLFICEDVEGNKLLRNLEPPEHDEWKATLDPLQGKEIIAAVRSWITGNLKELAAEESDDSEEVPGLEKFLPYDEDSEKESLANKSRSKPADFAELEEGPVEVGAEREETEDEVEDHVRKPSSLTPSSGDDPNYRHGNGSRRHRRGGGGNNNVDPDGDAIKRIDTSAVKFRIIHTGRSEMGNAEYCLVIEPLADVEGAIDVVALGNDSTVYPIPLAYAEPWDKESGSFSIEKSYINGLKLKKGKELRIKIGTMSKSRYALGIENYES